MLADHDQTSTSISDLSDLSGIKRMNNDINVVLGSTDKMSTTQSPLAQLMAPPIAPPMPPTIVPPIVPGITPTPAPPTAPPTAPVTAPTLAPVIAPLTMLPTKPRDGFFSA